MYQFRIPYTRMCPTCREEIKKAVRDYRRLKHREYMQEYRKVEDKKVKEK